MCSTCFPPLGLPADASLSSTGSSGASSPASSVVSKRYDFLPPIPPHFVAFAWRYLSGTRLSSLPDGRVRRRSLELVTRYLRPGISEETTGSPKFLGNPDCPFAHVLADAGRTAHTRPLRCSSMAPGNRTVQRLPHWVFRRSIAWLSDWLSTLRRADYSDPTQNSLPVTGQALPDGLSTHKIPMRGFKIVSLHLYPPLPSFAWRNGGDRRTVGKPARVSHHATPAEISMAMRAISSSSIWLTCPSSMFGASGLAGSARMAKYEPQRRHTATAARASSARRMLPLGGTGLASRYATTCWNIGTVGGLICAIGAPC